MSRLIVACLLLAALSACGGETQRSAQTGADAATSDEAPLAVAKENAESDAAEAVNSSEEPSGKRQASGAEPEARQQPNPVEVDGPAPAAEDGQAGAEPDGPPENVEPEKLNELPGEEVQTNKVYSAGVELKVSVYGIGFKVPAGMRTAIQQGAEGFVMESTEKQVLGAIYMRREVKLADVKELLSESQDMGDGVVLAVRGRVEEKDGVLRAGYGDGTYTGYCAAKVGEHGNGVAFFIAAAQADEAYIKQKVEELIASARLVPAQESQDEKAWRQLLGGHKLTYMRSSYSGGVGGSYTGSSTREEISLSADGSFHYYYKDSFSIDTGASGGYSGGHGRGGDEDRGRWRVELAGANVQLVLEGENKTRRFNLAYSDQKTYLNGTRYFRVPLE